MIDLKYQIEFLSDPHYILINISECTELLHYMQRQRRREWFSSIESCNKQGFKLGSELFKVDGCMDIFTNTESCSIRVECCDDFSSYIITDCNSEEFVKECSRFVNLVAIGENFLNEWDHKIQQILMIVKSCCPECMCVDMEWKKYISVPSMRQYDCKTQHRHEMLEKCYLISNI